MPVNEEQSWGGGLTPAQFEALQAGGGGGGGDASAANQLLGNAELAAINTDIGAPADAPATSDTGAFSLFAFIKRLLQAVGGVSATGSIAANAQFVEIPLQGQSSATATITGTWVGTLQFEVTVDGTTWVPALGILTGGSVTATTGTTLTANGSRAINTSGALRARVVATAWTSGTATVNLRAGCGAQMIHGIPTGMALGSGAAGTTTFRTIPATDAVHQGQAARGAAVTGNPMVVGARGATAAPTAVTNGQVVDPQADTLGRLINRPWTIPELAWSFAGAAGGIINTTDVVLAAAAGAGIRRYINRISLSNNSATATEVVVKDGASTVIARFSLPANAANVAHQFEPPIASSANAALNIACLTTAAAVYANAQGFTAP